MNIKDKIGFAVTALLYIIIFHMFISMDVEDYLEYKKDSNKYHIVTVKVEETTRRYLSHVNTGIFYYSDKYGVQKKGEISLNYNENAGDYI